jgi:hypothetical protein
MDCLRDCQLKRVTFTYDIWCKWVINARKRIREFFPADEAEHFLSLDMRGFIPKLHNWAHGKLCRTRYSINYHHGMARTDGESTERDWAAAVLAALQTAEMNPGGRHAALDDHWIDRNFRRVVGLSEFFRSYLISISCTIESLLLRWFRDAVKWSRIQQDAVTELESGQSSEVISLWTDMVAAWDADHDKPDPYEEPETSKSPSFRAVFRALSFVR